MPTSPEPSTMPTSTKPTKPDRLLAFTLDPALKAELDRQAKAQERSIAAQARHYIRRGLEADAKAQSPKE